MIKEKFGSAVPAPARWQRAHQWIKAMAEANPGIVFQAIIGDYIITAECDKEENTMKVEIVNVTIRYTLDNSKAAWNVVELAAEGSVDALENWSNGASAATAMEPPPEPDSIKGLYVD